MSLLDRCTGHCCRSIWLPLYANGVFELRAELAGARGHVRENGEYVSSVPRVDGGRLLFVSKADAERVASLFRFVRMQGRGSFHACSAFDADTGDCTEYESRPALCREYPYGDPCEQPACTWRAVAMPMAIAPRELVRPRGWWAIRIWREMARNPAARSWRQHVGL